MSSTLYTTAELEFIKENAHHMFDKDILAVLNRLRDAEGGKPPLTLRQIYHIRARVLGIAKETGTRYKGARVIEKREGTGEV